MSNVKAKLYCNAKQSREFIFIHIRGLSGKFADTANKTRIVYHRLMKFCMNKYQLSGLLRTKYDCMFKKKLTDLSVIKEDRGMVHGACLNLTFIL